jgi:hypothetical protein
VTAPAIIFAGPTLPPAIRPKDDASFAWRPPVCQGELYRAALSRPAAIGIVDGYFEVVPTVWHKEILWAMAAGIPVYGAASIGALRAAELDLFGMRGVGRVYQDFRDGVLVDDDEVAVLHGPEELGYPPLTEAMVDIRATLAAASRAGIIQAAAAACLTGVAKGLFYKERTYAAVFAAAGAEGLPGAALQSFADWLPQGRVEQKRRDAEAMLDAIRAHLTAGAPKLRVSWRFAETSAWHASRGRTDSLC